jgi:type I restriction enzyme M protein
LLNANKQLVEIFERKIKVRIAKVWGVKEKRYLSSQQANKENIAMAAEPVEEYIKSYT